MSKQIAASTRVDHIDDLLCMAVVVNDGKSDTVICHCTHPHPTIRHEHATTIAQALNTLYEETNRSHKARVHDQCNRPMTRQEAINNLSTITVASRPYIESCFRTIEQDLLITDVPKLVALTKLCIDANISPNLLLTFVHTLNSDVLKTFRDND